MPARPTKKHRKEKMSSLVLLYVKHGTKHGSLVKVIEEADSLNLGIDPRSIYRYAKLWNEGQLCSCGELRCHMAPQCWQEV